MTEEQRQAAAREWEQAKREATEEEEELDRRIKEEGRYRGGLDGNALDFKPINDKLKRRLREIQEKYGINTTSQE